MRKIILSVFCFFVCLASISQVKWVNVDSLYQPLPASVHIYSTTTAIDTAPFRAFYLIADLGDKKINFTVDTTLNRRLTPKKFYTKCADEKIGTNDCPYPLVVVNCSFFSFETNRNLDIIIQNRKLIGYNVPVFGRGKDTFTYRHPFTSAIGISKKRTADVAWTFTDSSQKYAYSTPWVLDPIKDSIKNPSLAYIKSKTLNHEIHRYQPLKKWKMQTAVGGGPVLLHEGEINITNDKELRFAGKAINDKHPRTAMGYTKNNKLIILVIEGRNKNSGGATLRQEAQIFKDLGCWEALNLDGGGSSCMLVNGKETIKPSDVTGERPVPAVFEIFR